MLLAYTRLRLHVWPWVDEYRRNRGGLTRVLTQSNKVSKIKNIYFTRREQRCVDGGMCVLFTGGAKHFCLFNTNVFLLFCMLYSYGHAIPLVHYMIWPKFAVGSLVIVLTAAVLRSVVLL